MEKIDRRTKMLIIPETTSETTDTAKSKLTEALKEEDTIFLLFRSDSQNESQIQGIVTTADNYAQKWGKEMYRVVWIKKQDILKDIADKYFGNDKKIIAVSLRCGAGEPREVVSKYELSEIDDTIKIGRAFSNAA